MPHADGVTSYIAQLAANARRMISSAGQDGDVQALSRSADFLRKMYSFAEREVGEDEQRLTGFFGRRAGTFSSELDQLRTQDPRAAEMVLQQVEPLRRREIGITDEETQRQLGRARSFAGIEQMASSTLASAINAPLTVATLGLVDFDVGERVASAVGGGPSTAEGFRQGQERAVFDAVQGAAAKRFPHLDEMAVASIWLQAAYSSPEESAAIRRQLIHDGAPKEIVDLVSNPDLPGVIDWGQKWLPGLVDTVSSLVPIGMASRAVGAVARRVVPAAVGALEMGGAKVAAKGLSELATSQGAGAQVIRAAGKSGAGFGLYETARARQEGEQGGLVARLKGGAQAAVLGAGLGAAGQVAALSYGWKGMPSWLADSRKFHPERLAELQQKSSRLELALGRLIDAPKTFVDVASGGVVEALHGGSFDDVKANALLFALVGRFRLSPETRSAALKKMAGVIPERIRKGSVGQAALRIVDPEVAEHRAREDVANSIALMKAHDRMKVESATKLLEERTGQGSLIYDVPLPPGGLPPEVPQEAIRLPAETPPRSPVIEADPVRGRPAKTPDVIRLPEQTEPPAQRPSEVPTDPAEAERRILNPGLGWSAQAIETLDKDLAALSASERAASRFVGWPTELKAEGEHLHRLMTHLRGGINTKLRMSFGMTLEEMLQVEPNHRMWTEDPVFIALRANYPLIDPSTGKLGGKGSVVDLGTPEIRERLERIFGMGEFVDEPWMIPDKSGSKRPATFFEVIAREARRMADRYGIRGDQAALGRMEEVGIETPELVVGRFDPAAKRTQGPKVGEPVGESYVKKFVLDAARRRMQNEAEKIRKLRASGRSFEEKPLESIDDLVPPEAREILEETTGAQRESFAERLRKEGAPDGLVELWKNPNTNASQIQALKILSNRMRERASADTWDLIEHTLKRTVLRNALQAGGILNLRPQERERALVAWDLWLRRYHDGLVGHEVSRTTETSARGGRSATEIARSIYESNPIPGPDGKPTNARFGIEPKGPGSWDALVAEGITELGPTMKSAGAGPEQINKAAAKRADAKRAQMARRVEKAVRPLVEGLDQTARGLTVLDDNGVSIETSKGVLDFVRKYHRQLITGSAIAAAVTAAQYVAPGSPTGPTTMLAGAMLNWFWPIPEGHVPGFRVPMSAYDRVRGNFSAGIRNSLRLWRDVHAPQDIDPTTSGSWFWKGQDYGLVRKYWFATLGDPEDFAGSKPINLVVSSELRRASRKSGIYQKLFGRNGLLRSVKEDGSVDRVVFDWLDGWRRPLSRGSHENEWSAKERMKGPEGRVLFEKILAERMAELSPEEQKQARAAHDFLRKELDSMREEAAKVFGRELPEQWGIDDYIPHLYPDALPHIEWWRGAPAFLRASMPWGAKSTARLLTRYSDRVDYDVSARRALKNYFGTVIDTLELKKLGKQLEPYIRGTYIPTFKAFGIEKNESGRLQVRKGAILDLARQLRAFVGPQQSTDLLPIYRGRRVYLLEAPRITRDPETGKQRMRLKLVDAGTPLKDARAEPEKYVKDVSWMTFATKSTMRWGGLAQTGMTVKYELAQKWADWVLGKGKGALGEAASRSFGGVLADPTKTGAQKSYGVLETGLAKSFHWLANLMYHNTIGGLNPRPSLHNFIGGQWMAMSELGGKFYVDGIAQFSQALAPGAKGREIRDLIRRSGVVAEGSGFLTDLPSVSAIDSPRSKLVKQLHRITAGALSAASKTSMGLFRLTEDTNRIVTYLGGRARALDRLKTEGPTPEQIDRARSRGLGDKEMVEEIAHQEGVTTLGRAVAIYSMAKTPGAFRNPAGRVLLHLMRYNVMYLNELARAMSEVGHRPQKLTRAVVSGFLVSQLGQVLGRDLNFIFGTRVKDFGQDAMEMIGIGGGLGDFFPSMLEDSGQSFLQGLLDTDHVDENVKHWLDHPMALVGEIVVPFPNMMGVSAPLYWLGGIAKMASAAWNNDEPFFEALTYETTRQSQRMLDLTFPGWAVSRKIAQAFEIGEPPWGMRPSGDPEKPWAVLGDRKRVVYKTDRDALLWNLFGAGTSSETMRSLWNMRLLDAHEKRHERSREMAYDRVTDHLDLYRSDKDPAHLKSAFEIMDKMHLDARDVERQLELKFMPSDMRRLMRGTNDFRVAQIFRRWQATDGNGNRLWGTADLVEALDLISDWEGLSAEALELVGRMVREAGAKRRAG